MEIVEARKALKAALRIFEVERRRSAGRSQRLYAMMDSQQAIKAVMTGRNMSSIGDDRTFRT